ncbi:MAG: glycosyltransferase family 39 protein [Saprospiraceae bacterium]|nr:glycosyltransferase family 39 protein [Saprospiraceae bacterium]
MAGSIKLFGSNEFAVRLPSVLLSLLSVFLTFLIGTELFSKRTGVIAAFFLAINGFFLDITAGRTTTDHIDCAFLFFVLFGIYLAIKYYSSNKTWLFAAAAIVCGFALLTKWLPALIIVGLFGLMGLTNKVGFAKNAIATILFTVILFLVYLPWRLYTQQQYPLEFAWEQTYNLRHLTEALEGHRHPWWYYLNWIRIIWSEAIYLVLIFLIWQVFKFKYKNQIILLVWLLVPLIVFSFSATKMPGYLLIAAPAAFIAMALFCEYLLLEFKYRKLGVAVVVAIALLAQRYCIERVKPFYKNHKKENISLEIKRLKNSIGNAPTVLYGNPFPIETMFYTDYISYASLPTEKGMKNAHLKGYQIAVLDNGRLPKELLMDSQVLKIRSLLVTFNPI